MSIIENFGPDSCLVKNPLWLGGDMLRLKCDLSTLASDVL